jgi:hypothetical protein
MRRKGAGAPHGATGCNGSGGNHISNAGNEDTSVNDIEYLKRIQNAKWQQQAIAQQ